METRQCADTLLMIRPVNFRYNEQTAVNNYYQKIIDHLQPDEVQRKVAKEFDDFVTKLKEKGVRVITVDDTPAPDKPDAIFPNNWISFHEDGRVGLYPMYARNRRMERRDEILALLKNAFGFRISGVEDFSHYERDDKFLESTGSMILDRSNKIVYAALSFRTNEQVLDDFCEKFNYKPVKFTGYQTVGDKRLPIYHTNVMMSLGDDFAILCKDAIDNPAQLEQVITFLQETGKEIISISETQKYFFAGNMLQVSSATGEKYLVMSSAAYKALDSKQIETINKHCPVIHSSLDTIEALGGGSARCMMAEVFLPKRQEL